MKRRSVEEEALINAARKSSTSYKGFESAVILRQKIGAAFGTENSAYSRANALVALWIARWEEECEKILSRDEEKKNLLIELERAENYYQLTK